MAVEELVKKESHVVGVAAQRSTFHIYCYHFPVLTTVDFVMASAIVREEP